MQLWPLRMKHGYNNLARSFILLNYTLPASNLQVFTVTLHIYTCRTAMQYNRPGLPLIQAKTGSWSVGRKQADTLSWNSQGTGPLVMTETETFRYCLSV